MQPTEILSSEHRIIERAIAALQAAADRLEAGESVRAGFFVDGARFIRDFADGYHHGKEEGVLFPAMARNGMPTDAGPIGVMLYEHERGREITAGLRNAADRLASGDRSAADAVIEHARGYGALLTQHIYKEDNILFAMATQLIPPGEQDGVLDEFEQVERERARNGDSKASFVDLVNALCTEIGVDADAASSSAVRLPWHAR